MAAEVEACLTCRNGGSGVEEVWALRTYSASCSVLAYSLEAYLEVLEAFHASLVVFDCVALDQISCQDRTAVDNPYGMPSD